MKYLIVLIALGAAGYAFYNRQQGLNPEVIEAPVYAELRTDIRIQGREIDMVLYGEMASQEDCQERASRMWHTVNCVRGRRD